MLERLRRTPLKASTIRSEKACASLSTIILSFFAANMAEMKGPVARGRIARRRSPRTRMSTRKRQYTRTARRILGCSAARQLTMARASTPAPERTARTGDKTDRSYSRDFYALFGMMNLIYNWYDPRGKSCLSVNSSIILLVCSAGFLSREQARQVGGGSGRPKK